MARAVTRPHHCYGGPSPGLRQHRLCHNSPPTRVVPLMGRGLELFSIQTKQSHKFWKCHSLRSSAELHCFSTDLCTEKRIKNGHNIVGRIIKPYERKRNICVCNLDRRFFLPGRPGLISRANHERLAVDKLVLWHIFLRVLGWAGDFLSFYQCCF